LRVLSSRWFKISLSLGLFAFLVRSTDLWGFVQQILAARLELFGLAFVGYLTSQVLSAYKWRMLARPLGFNRPLGTFVTCYFVGMYLNLFAPSTVVGDVGRGWLLAEQRGRVGAALQSVLIDRLSGLVTLLWVSAAGFLLFGPTVLPAVVCYGVISAAFFVVIGWWVLPHVLGVLFTPAHKFRQTVEKLVVPYQAAAGVLAWACLFSFGFHLFQLILQMLLARALGVVVPFWYLLLCIPLVHILSALPVSFGGIGVREGGYVVFLALVGIDRDQALAFGLLWSAIVFGAGVLGGLVLLFSPEVRLSLRRSVARTATPTA
jgi:uncharacterized membrane protein YbhN (UPF0104 family)